MPEFNILPAIDLKDGHCVRLRQGRADEATVYGADPVAQAVEWARQGGRWLHVVDLTGAFQGHPAHAELIGRMAAAVAPVPVECGGGLRTDADLEALLAAGVRRAILGTRALENTEALSALASRFQDRLAVGIDARDGRVQVKGWTETSQTSAVDLARRAAAAGIRTIIYTDTATDGMLRGPNVESTAAVCDSVADTGCGIVASGGVSSVEDVRRLRALRRENLVGAIVGKALYEGRVTLADLLEEAARD